MEDIPEFDPIDPIENLITGLTQKIKDDFEEKLNKDPKRFITSKEGTDSLRSDIMDVRDYFSANINKKLADAINEFYEEIKIYSERQKYLYDKFFIAKEGVTTEVKPLSTKTIKRLILDKSLQNILNRVKPHDPKNFMSYFNVAV